MVSQINRYLTAEQALPGRSEPMPVRAPHFVLNTALSAPFPTGYEKIILGMGCFWGVERLFWSLEGVYTTAAGYSAGFTPNPTYQEVCSGLTGHNEVVLVVYDPAVLSLSTILALFWQSHNPTQGMRQGNDIGTQYRSGIYYTHEAQQQAALQSLKHYQQSLLEQGYGAVTTEVLPASEFYYAEDYHQQYLAKNPAGYCGLRGTGVPFN